MMREWTSPDGRLKLYNMDCMDFMRGCADGAYQLAVVDPPYGIGMDGGNVGYKGFNDFKQGGWDKAIPEAEYFLELRRSSCGQVIWGGNYFAHLLQPTRGWIVWDKGEGFEGRTYAEVELAWTSFDRNARKFKRDPLANGDYRGKIHICQKPVALYRWLFQNYAKPGDRILDTHVGSASSFIAAWEKGFEIVGCELDADYFNAAVARIEKAIQQPSLPFDTPPAIPEWKAKALF